MATINLSGKDGGQVIVDDADFHFLNQWKWRKNIAGYACRNVRRNGKIVKLMMHHVVLPPESDVVTDHINRNRLDNRRENLRNVPHWMNCHNRAARANNRGSRGVTKPKGRNRWRAVIRVNSKIIQLGYFPTQHEAETAYANAQRRFGV